MNDAALRESMADVVRTLIKAVGGALVAKGVIDASALATLAGAGGILFGLLWSWVSTRNLAKGA